MKLKQLHLIQTRGLSSSKKRYDLDRLIAISALFPAPPSHTGSVGPIAYFCFAARLPRRFWRLSAKSAGSVRSCTPFSTGCRRKNVSPRSSSQRRLDVGPLSVRFRLEWSQTAPAGAPIPCGVRRLWPRTTTFSISSRNAAAVVSQENCRLQLKAPSDNHRCRSGSRATRIAARAIASGVASVSIPVSPSLTASW